MPRGQYDRAAARQNREASTTEAQPTRADEVRQERRKRPGLAAYSGINLSVDEALLDRETYHYRFANDINGRVQQLYAQDYDPAPESAKPNSNSLGTLSSAHAGVDEGRPFNAVLMRKRKDWFETDQVEKQKPLNDMEDAIRRGNPNHSANTDLRGPGVYTPDTGNTIERV